MKPLARKKDTIVEELPGETVIFDKKNNKVHCLNSIALTVWANANGKRSIADLAKIVAAESDCPCDDAVIESAVHQLAEAELIEETSTEKLLSRRDVGRKLALAGSCAALVATIVAPTPAKASSQDPTGWHTAHRSDGWFWPEPTAFNGAGKGSPKYQFGNRRTKRHHVPNLRNS
jgi:hypothetical protein